MGIPPTGKPINVWLIVISRFVDGKIAEEWELPDALSMMQQIGLIPARP
ncbi:MAG: ester cyclase [candidate division Zixibacteria bacterium]|nr:ester cyclase [candidate division Zixibacteria bacterium]